MPHLDLKAVPRLVSSPDTVISSGIERTEAEWSDAILSLRPRLLALTYRELCSLLRELYFQDLFCLVVNAPYGHDLLARLQDGLSQSAWEMLRDDCEKQGEAHLGDFAPSVYARVDQALTALEASHATTDQQDQLQALSRQMLGLEDGAFKFCLDNIPIEVLNALLSVTGGLESAWSGRARQFISDKAWAMIAEDYPDTAAEPLTKNAATQCLTNLPALMEGQPWPVDGKYVAPEQMDVWFAEMEDLLHPENNPKKG